MACVLSINWSARKCDKFWHYATSNGHNVTEQICQFQGLSLYRVDMRTQCFHRWAARPFLIDRRTSSATTTTSSAAWINKVRIRAGRTHYCIRFVPEMPLCAVFSELSRRKHAVACARAVAGIWAPTKLLPLDWAQRTHYIAVHGYVPFLINAVTSLIIFGLAIGFGCESITKRSVS